MRRVLGPIAHDKWKNKSTMIGWCLYRAEAGEFTHLLRHWNATEVETAGRLIAWGVPNFVLPALLGLPLAEARTGDDERIYRWVKDEERILEHQYDPFQEGRFNDGGSSADNGYARSENPYRGRENISGSLGVTHVSARRGNFGSLQQDNRLQEERPGRAGNSTETSHETEAHTLGEIDGLGGFDNFGYREPSNRTRGEGPRSVGNGTKNPYKSNQDGLDR